MSISAQVFVQDTTDFRISQVWEHQNPAEPQTALALYLGYDLTVHLAVEDLERLFGVINEHLEVIHKARKAEKEAERYAEAMHDQLLSEGVSLS